VAFAFEEAAARRAPLVAVHVWWDLLLDPVTLPSLDWDGMARQERAQLAERLAGWQEKYPDVAVECWCAARSWSCRGELLKLEMGERKAS
jgi:hypothetical protein